MTDTYTVRYEWDERGIKRAVRTQPLNEPLVDSKTGRIPLWISFLATGLRADIITDTVIDGRRCLEFVCLGGRDEAQQG